MRSLKTFSTLGLGLLALGAWSAVSAATIDFTTSPNAGTNKWSVGGITVSVGAWSVYNPTNGPVSSGLGRYTTGLGVTSPWDNQSGYDTSSHWHSIDNKKGIDYAKLDFSTQVRIESIVIEVWRQDADMTLGFGDNWNDNLKNIDWDQSQRTSAQSQLVTINLTNLGLSFDDEWRIFAQLTGTNSCGNYCSGNDGFKLRSVTFSAVPIPAAVWLFGSAVLGMAGVGYRRRQSV